MPSALERRLDRVAGALATDDEARVVYCVDEAEAERLTGEADQARRIRPICIVAGKSAGGTTVREVLAFVAVHGRRIHDKPAGPMPSGYIWPRISGVS